MFTIFDTHSIEEEVAGDLIQSLINIGLMTEEPKTVWSYIYSTGGGTGTWSTQYHTPRAEKLARIHEKLYYKYYMLNLKLNGLYEKYELSRFNPVQYRQLNQGQEPVEQIYRCRSPSSFGGEKV